MILVNLHAIEAVASVASSGKFYRLPPDKENTGMLGSSCVVYVSLMGKEDCYKPTVIIIGFMLLH